MIFYSKTLQWFPWIMHPHSPWGPEVLPDQGSHVFCQATCRTGKPEGLCKTSSHLSLQSPVTFCFLALFSAPIISSQVMKTNTVSLKHTERKYCLLHIISMCLLRALQQWSEYGIIQKNALCSSCFPHCELFQNLMPSDSHSGHGTKNSFKQRIH